MTTNKKTLTCLILLKKLPVRILINNEKNEIIIQNYFMGGSKVKKVAIYVLIVLTFLVLFAGCKNNETKASPTPMVTHTPLITAMPTHKPETTKAPVAENDLKPDVDDGVVTDEDGVITPEDHAKKTA